MAEAVQEPLVVTWITQRRAKAYVEAHHRHHPPPTGAILTLGVFAPLDRLVGVAYLGRPSAPFLGRLEAEVTRVATNGTANAPSALYGATRRVAKQLGITRLITYTLASEPGTSLVAAGWIRDGVVKGRSWSRPKRPREDKHPLEDKVRWRAW